MPVPKQNKVLSFIYFFDVQRIYSPNLCLFSALSPKIKTSGAIFHGVEHFLIIISHNNYGMLENMSRYSTLVNDYTFAG